MRRRAARQGDHRRIGDRRRAAASRRSARCAAALRSTCAAREAKPACVGVKHAPSPSASGQQRLRSWILPPWRSPSPGSSASSRACWSLCSRLLWISSHLVQERSERSHDRPRIAASLRCPRGRWHRQGATMRGARWRSWMRSPSVLASPSPEAGRAGQGPWHPAPPEARRDPPAHGRFTLPSPSDPDGWTFILVDGGARGVQPGPERRPRPGWQDCGGMNASRRLDTPAP